MVCIAIHVVCTMFSSFLAHIKLGFISSKLGTGGGKGVTSAWSPLGNFLEGQAHPNLHRTRFCYFFDMKFFVFAFRWFFTEVFMFIFE